MIKKRHLFVRNAVAILAATPLFWFAPSVNAQSSFPSSQESRTSPNSDITRQELARFDQFLDNHQEIAQQLRRDPSLVNDQNYVQGHPELQNFLQDHPGVREEIKENPNYFMRQENRYDRREDARDDNNRRQELARFDQFLDGHREVSEQLRRDPSLVKNQQFVESHPALQSFLQEHPRVREDLTQNPDAFMRQEERYDRREDAAREDARRFNNQDNDVRQDRDRDADRDADRRGNGRRAELAQFDRFLDTHRETAEQLRRDPSLVKNQQFLQNHPALQAYLQDHQGVREQLYQDPNGFMHQQKTYESRENAMGRGDMNREHSSFGQFLGTHSGISGELSKNPSLLKNHEYMSSHPELQAYLKTHPDAQGMMAKDPDSFMKASQQFSSTKTGTSTSTTAGTTGTVKTTTPDASKPAEAPKPPKQ